MGRWQPAGLTEGQLPRKRIPRNTARARHLRQQMALPEVLLWNLLRRSPDGVIFRRQHSLDSNIVVDFYCARAKLCIEIDGIVHDMGDNPHIDDARNSVLQSLGLEVIRIPATDVLKSPQDVAEALVRRCKQ